HGDIDLSLDFMLGSGSRSAIYLLGTYGIQLADIWESHHAAAMHGRVMIGYDGDSSAEGFRYPPRQSVGRGPGLWQRLTISFQAPRFDESGGKTENARIIKAEINGVIIHENIEFSGVAMDAMARE